MEPRKDFQSAFVVQQKILTYFLACGDNSFRQSNWVYRRKRQELSVNGFWESRKSLR